MTTTNAGLAATPLADDAAFPTGSAFIVLHSDARKIERTLRDELDALRADRPDSIG